jgi:NodT family efflux transporter outer membrane factor (OMF) lipoprotein
MNWYNLIYVFLLALSISACRSNQDLSISGKPSLPRSYINNKDSGRVELSNYKTFFQDSVLISIIDTALYHNFDLLMALQKIQIAGSQLRFTKGILLPDLSFNASSGVRKFGDYTMDGVGNYDTQFSTNINEKQQIPNPLPDYYIGLQSTWEIDLWGKLRNKKKAAVARFIASDHGKNLVLTTLISDIASAYYDLLALETEKIIVLENIKLQQDALDIVNLQKQAGKANQLGVELLSAQLLNSKNFELDLRQKIQLTENNLNFLKGGFPTLIPRDSGFITRPLLPKIKSGIPSELLDNRPDIKQAEFEMKAANSDVLSAKAAFYPSFNISGAVGYQAFNALLLLETPASLVYNIAGGLAAPLLNRRNIKAQLLSSETSYKLSYVNYHKTIVNGFYEVYNSMLRLQVNEEMFALKSQEVSVLKQSINTSQELFKTGRANYLEIITAQKNALQSQLELVALKKRQFLFSIDLYRSLGGGWK